jgi:inhibitor of cysteine peptidase
MGLYPHEKEPYMKKTIWILAVVLVIASIAIGATYAVSATNSNGNLSISAADSGKQITLNAGDSFILTLDSNTASTGFSWTNASVSNGSVVKEIGRESKEPDSKRIGASGQEIWTFKTLEKSTSTISMNYSKAWETEVTPAATFNVTIIVK